MATFSYTVSKQLSVVLFSLVALSATMLQAKDKEPPADQAEKERAKTIEQIERKLGKKPDGYYVVGFMRTEYVFVQKAGRVAPFTRTFVEQYPDRKAAAEAILDCLVKFHNLQPTRGNQRAPTTRPPTVDWRPLGHFEKPEQATAAVEKARAAAKVQGTALADMPAP